jgi:hypothetical protein
VEDFGISGVSGAGMSRIAVAIVSLLSIFVARVQIVVLGAKQKPQPLGCGSVELRFSLEVRDARKSAKPLADTSS